MRTQLLVPALAVVLLLSGCATPSTQNLYSGPERPADEVASVVVPWQIQVRSVNGQKVPLSLFSGSQKESTVRVLPGAQEWSVRYYDPFADDRRDRDPYVDQTGVVPLRFTAEAGRAYRLKFETPKEDPALRDAKQQVRFLVAESDSDVSQPGVEPDGAQRAPEPVAIEQAALDQLKSWWRVAGPAERREFMEWANEKN
jgi:uncharacterized protein YccT (UPF0319 family)